MIAKFDQRHSENLVLQGIALTYIVIIFLWKGGRAGKFQASLICSSLPLGLW